MSARAFWAFLAVLAVVGLLAYGLASKGSASISVGQPVPDLTLPRLQGKRSADIAAYRGRWVLVAWLLFRHTVPAHPIADLRPSLNCSQCVEGRS